jgi:hypothetical protein
MADVSLSTKTVLVDSSASAPAKGGTADWLCLAASPTFAIMALLTAVGGAQTDLLCAAVHDASPLGGMTLMYLLMSAFHLAPWLRRLSN